MEIEEEIHARAVYRYYPTVCISSKSVSAYHRDGVPRVRSIIKPKALRRYDTRKRQATLRRYDTRKRQAALRRHPYKASNLGCYLPAPYITPQHTRRSCMLAATNPTTLPKKKSVESAQGCFVSIFPALAFL